MGDAPSDPRSRSSSEAHAPLDVPAAERLARAARAAEGLCAVLWETLHDELRPPHAYARSERVAGLAERLAQICSAVADLADTATPETLTSEMLPSEPSSAEPVAAYGAYGDVTPAPFPEPPASPQEIAIHDARGEGPAAWVQAIGGSLERHARDGLPFAVLLVEVLDVERLARAEPAAEIAHLLTQLEGVLRQELRPHDAITLESRGRWWLTVPLLDARGARSLAERLARAARSAASHRGAPLKVAIGIAACPEDGRDAATLAAHSDVGLYAARSAGQPLPPGEIG